MTPRVVVGIPTYRGAQHLESALRSLLAQPSDRVAFVLVDDCSGDGTVELARRMAVTDQRLHVHENRRRLGMVGNWNRVLDLARDAAPGAEYFAWASDHDLRDPGWLAPLVAALDDDTGTVLAYPHVERFDDHGRGPGSGWSFDTANEPDPHTRLARGAREMVAGDMVYGVFRRDALEAAGGFPACVYPDRLLLARLSLLGRFRQLPLTTWHRRMGVASTPRRQRRTLFADGAAPRSASMPWWLVHGALLVPDAGPLAATRYALVGAVVAARSVPRRVMSGIRPRGR